MQGISRLRSAIARSGSESSRGNHDAAVAVLLTPIEEALTLRVSRVAMQFQREHPWPLTRIRVYRNELTIHVEPLARSFSEREACMLRGYADALCEMPTPGLVERTVIVLECLTRSIAKTRLSLKWQLRCNRIFTKLRWLCLRGVAGTKDYFDKTAFGLSILLKEPKASAMRLLQEHELFVLHNHSLRKFHQVQDAKRVQYLAGFRWPELDAYRRYIRGNTQSRILMTIHMGDFLGAFARISQECPTNWSVLALRREQNESADPLEQVQFCANTSLLRPGQYSTVDVVARLRSGRHTLAILCDLGAKFGQTDRVNFLGQMANFVRGPASIAVLSKVPIVPFVCYHNEGCEHIEMHAPMQYKSSGEEGFSQAVNRMTQQLVRMTEQWVLQHPQQWKYLPEVFSFLQANASAGDAIDTESAL